jgi:hypothetical protein
VELPRDSGEAVSTALRVDTAIEKAAEAASIETVLVPSQP